LKEREKVQKKGKGVYPVRGGGGGGSNKRDWGKQVSDTHKSTFLGCPRGKRKRLKQKVKHIQGSFTQGMRGARPTGRGGGKMVIAQSWSHSSSNPPS